MRPAICSICEKPSAYSDGGDWVKFNDYDEHIVTLLSHPIGLEYFSGAYIEEARALAHMNSCDAIRKIKENNCIDSSKSFKASTQQVWWKRLLKIFIFR